MAVSERALELLVGAALPTGAQFGRENFAGDPLVQRFCEWAKEMLKVEVNIFVSWSCPPDVSILTSSGVNILIRSERFDTLLVEYLHLKDAASPRNPLTDLVLPPATLRWMAEFLLGYRWPQAALYTAIRAHELRIDPRPPNPFRDEALASVDEVQRVALQCFCLGHELGHLLPSQYDAPSLDTKVDGLSLSRHISRDIEEGGAAPVAEQMMAQARSSIDALNLLREIDADLIALELVAVFVANTLGVPAKEALQVALTAYEAQSFLYATKHTCALLRRYAGRDDRAEFTREDWIAGLQVSVRARCVLRRAGFLLSRWRAGDEKQTAATIDAMFLESIEFRNDLATVAQGETEHLLNTLPALNAQEGRPFFDSLIETARSDSEVRLDLFYMLIAMGFPGGTDPIGWLEHLFEMQQAGS